MLRLLFLLPLLFAMGYCKCAQSHEVSRAKRAVPFTTPDLWDKNVPIPYILDDRYNETQKTILRNGIQTLEDNTCLDFKEDYGSGLKLEYAFIDSGNCESGIGDTRLANKANHKVQLHSGCINTYTIQHETIHALGFRHTHTRPDRDEYVNLNYDNIDKSIKENFDKLKPTQTIDLGIPYEYNSIMHYDKFTGINKDIPAITSLDPDYNMTLGGDYIIFNDWKIINLYYKCNEKCVPQIECQNGGYQNSHQCDDCVCPLFHTGKRCEIERNPVNLTPGEIMVENVKWSYNRTANERYRNEDVSFDEFQQSTVKIIKAPEGTRINITIVKLNDRQMWEPTTCNGKAVEIVDGGDLTRVGKRFCHRSRNGYSFLSATNVIGFRVYAQPGLDFLANVTFTVVGTVEPTTEQIED